MTKRLSTCNQPRGRFNGRSFVPHPETTPVELSRRWEVPGQLHMVEIND